MYMFSMCCDSQASVGTHRTLIPQAHPVTVRDFIIDAYDEMGRTLIRYRPERPRSNGTRTSKTQKMD